MRKRQTCFTALSSVSCDTKSRASTHLSTLVACKSQRTGFYPFQTLTCPRSEGAERGLCILSPVSYNKIALGRDLFAAFMDRGNITATNNNLNVHANVVSK